MFMNARQNTTFQEEWTPELIPACPSIYKYNYVGLDLQVSK